MLAGVVMLLRSEMPLAAAGGKGFPATAIWISSRSGRLGWACFSQKHRGNFLDEGVGEGVDVGVGVDVIGLPAGRRREKQRALARSALRSVVVAGTRAGWGPGNRTAWRGPAALRRT